MTLEPSTRISFNRWRTLLLLAVLVFAQFSSVVHSEIHPFHEHSELCDVFYGVEHQSSDVALDFSIPLPERLTGFWQITPFISFVQKPETVYSSRAPPIA